MQEPITKIYFEPSGEPYFSTQMLPGINKHTFNFRDRKRFDIKVVKFMGRNYVGLSEITRLYKLRGLDVDKLKSL